MKMKNEISSMIDNAFYECGQRSCRISTCTHNGNVDGLALKRKCMRMISLQGPNLILPDLFCSVGAN